MSVSRLPAILLCVTFLGTAIAAPTSASTIALSERFRLDGVEKCSSAGTVQADVAAGAIRETAPCADSGLNGLVVTRGLFDANGLDLGVQIDVTRAMSSPFSTTTTAFANFVDFVTPTGGPAGAAGFAHFEFDVDGAASVRCRSTGCGSSDFDTFGILSVNSISLFMPCFGAVSLGCSSVGSGTLAYDVPVIFGQQARLIVGMSATFNFENMAGGGEGGLADWLHTAHLSDVMLLDANHQQVLNGALVSATEGVTYPSQTATPVPEPASLTLLSVGLAAWLRSKRARGMMVDAG